MDELKSVRSETDRESERSYIIGLKSGRKFFVPVYSWTVSDVWFVVLPINDISSKWEWFYDEE